MMIDRLKSSAWIFDVGLRRMSAQGAPGWAGQMMVFCMLALALMATAKPGVAADWLLIVVDFLTF
jgi:hypothetical protein